MQSLLSQQPLDMTKVLTRHRIPLLPLPTDTLDTLRRMTLLASKNYSRKIASVSLLSSSEIIQVNHSSESESECLSVCIDHIWFIQSSAGGHLGCFYLLATVKNATMSMSV